jgi:hypothetical protein
MNEVAPAPGINTNVGVAAKSLMSYSSWWGGVSSLEGFLGPIRPARPRYASGTRRQPARHGRAGAPRTRPLRSRAATRHTPNVSRNVQRQRLT